MGIRKYYFLILLLVSILFSSSISTAFAQTETSCPPDAIFWEGACTIHVVTDRNHYNDGDTIRISGNVGTINEDPNVAITIFITDPVGGVALEAQTSPSTDGSYSFTLIAGEDIQISGYYGIGVYYGNESSFTQIYFGVTTITPPTSPYTVSIPRGTAVSGCEKTNSCFSPYSISINVGDTVTWKNDDSVPHTVASDNIMLVPDARTGKFFLSGVFAAGATFAVTFDESGSYGYVDVVHPHMKGIVFVSDVSPPICSEDEVLENNECVPITCGPGEVLENNECVPITCGPGEVLENNECVPITCGPGEVLEEGVCVTRVLECGPGEVLENNECVPITCSEGEVLEEGVCVTRVLECGPGEVLENGVCVPISPGPCGVIEVLENGECVPIIESFPIWIIIAAIIAAITAAIVIFLLRKKRLPKEIMPQDVNICGKCRTVNSSTSKFCKKCGSSL